MAYTILNTDGSILTLLADNSVDNISTSLTLVGRNYNGFGEYFNNNFVKLIANFASDTINPPRNPLKGQLWYDTTEKKIKVYDGNFKPVSGSVVSSTQPTSLAQGDLWFDSTNNQLKVFNGQSTLLIGPAYPLGVGENAFVLPETPIKDTNLDVRQISLLKNYGKIIGAMSNEPFSVNTNDALTYFNTSTMSIVSGLKIIGDINYTGKINNNYNTLTIDLDVINSTTNNIVVLAHVTAQTNKIIEMLNAVFPISLSKNYIPHPLNSSSIEPGVPVNSEARVICYHSVPFKGYQIRKFIANGTPKTWDYVNVLNNPVFGTLTNVIATIPIN